MLNSSIWEGNQWVILANKCKFGRSYRLLSTKHLFLLQMLETSWKTPSFGFLNFWCQRFQAAGCNSPPPFIKTLHNRPGSRPRICVLSDSLISCHPFTINARSTAVIYAVDKAKSERNVSAALSLVPQNVGSSGPAGLCRVCGTFRV